MHSWLRSGGIEILTPCQGRDWLYVDWKGWHTAETVQEGCEAMLACLRTTGVSKVLNDNTNGVGNWVDAADWVAINWFPRMEAAGLRLFAWVQSPSRTARRSGDHALAWSKQKQVIWLFEDRASAERWLAEH